ncbi:MAG: hypothetical protein ACFHXK_07970 [bacterium]
MRWLWLAAGLLFVAPVTHADIYAYTNKDGDYIVSQNKPKDRNLSYAVLTDEGEFIRMVEGHRENVPITHWRPFFLPKEPHPFDGPEMQPRERQPSVEVEEVENE